MKLLNAIREAKKVCSRMYEKYGVEGSTVYILTEDQSQYAVITKKSYDHESAKDYYGTVWNFNKVAEITADKFGKDVWFGIDFLEKSFILE